MLTPLLFGEISDIQICNQFCLKMTEINGKGQHMVQTFLFLDYFDSLKLVEKSSITMG